MKLSEEEERQFAALASQLRTGRSSGLRRTRRLAWMVASAGIGTAAGGLMPASWTVLAGLVVATIAVNLLAASFLVESLNLRRDRRPR